VSSARLDALIERADRLIGSPCHRQAPLLAALPPAAIDMPEDEEDVFCVSYARLGIDLSYRAARSGGLALLALFLDLAGVPTPAAPDRGPYGGRLPLALPRDAAAETMREEMESHPLLDRVQRHEGTGTVLLFATFSTGPALRVGYAGERLTLVTVAEPLPSER